ncbi:hypothetical protein K449DRAFT_463257 [Hypoxylon sp. EC38]|nr:hypothetical protein K449DRAFT_463257 [Hypoxylon sp. EC38]
MSTEAREIQASPYHLYLGEVGSERSELSLVSLPPSLLKEDASITLVIPNSKQSHAARDLSRFHLHRYGGLQDWYVQSQRISVQGKVPVRSPLSAPLPNRDFERSDPEHQITVPMVTVPDKAASHAGQRTEVASQLNPTGYLRWIKRDPDCRKGKASYSVEKLQDGETSESTRMQINRLLLGY